MINGAEAGRVAAIGFGIVFIVLLILALSVKAMGLLTLFLGLESKVKKSDQGQDKK